MALVLDEVILPRQSHQLVYTLHVPKGECLAIMGLSGAGKSSLLHLIAGFEHPQSGTISFDGVSLRPLDPGDRPISILFQQNNLFEHLTVWDNVALGLRGTLRLSQEERTEVHEALTCVGLTLLHQKKPEEISGGEQQRAALARCILQKRPLLLLDEPFHSMAPPNRLDMLRLIKNLHTHFQFTILMITHHPEEALMIASSAAFVHQGRIIATGTPQEVLELPRPEIETFRQSYKSLYNTLYEKNHL